MNFNKKDLPNAFILLVDDIPNAHTPIANEFYMEGDPDALINGLIDKMLKFPDLRHIICTAHSLYHEIADNHTDELIDKAVNGRQS